MGDSIAFEEFGPLFLEEILTPDLVQAQVKGAIARRIWVEVPGLASGWADLQDVGAVSRTVKPCEIICVAPVHLKLHLATPLGSLPPVDIRFPLTLIFETYAPLYLYARIPELTASDVDLDCPNSNLLDKAILEGFGLFRAEFAKKVNESISASDHERLVDIEAALLNQTANVPAWPGPRIVDLRAPGNGMVPHDAEAHFEINPGSSVTGSLFMRKGEGLQISLYGQITYVPGPTFSHGGSGDFRIKTGRTWDDSESVTVTVDREAWGKAWSRIQFPSEKESEWFRAPSSDWFSFRLTSDETNSQCQIRMVQRRHGSKAQLAPDGSRICFDQFGQHFMERGLSKYFLTLKVNAELQKMKALGQPSFHWEHPALGPIDIECFPTLKHLESQPALHPGIQELRALELEANIQAFRQPAQPSDDREAPPAKPRKAGKPARERLFSVPVTIGIVLGITATKHPVALQIDLQEVTKFDLDAAKLQCLDEGIEKLVRRLLESELADKLKTEIIKLANEKIRGIVVMTQVISKISEDMAKQTPMKDAEPVPVFNGYKANQVLMPGQADFHPFKLRKGQKITASVSLTPAAPPFVFGVLCTLAVCDAHGGLLLVETVTIPPGKPKTRKMQLNFISPQDGEFKVLVRCHPLNGDDFKSVSYSLTVE